ncbi:MAG: VanZ family protein [Marmoricola sp.]
MRWIAAFFLALYALFVARLTLADPSAGAPVFSAANYWGELLSGGRLSGTQLEVLANIALFVPAGFLLAVVLLRPLTALGLCILASAGIELAQREWFASRVPSVADVVHNGYGAALGVLAFAVVGWGIRWLNPEPRSTEQPA